MHTDVSQETVGSHRWPFPDVHMSLLLGFTELPQVENHKFVLFLVTDGLHFLLNRGSKGIAGQSNFSPPAVGSVRRICPEGYESMKA